MDPNFASAHFNLSIAYQDMGKYDLWLQEWEKYATAANDREDLAVARCASLPEIRLPGCIAPNHCA